ncbi:MAG TPA: M20/M25/M40 family metallo-hydrolase, partial [Nitrososphaerales archaeon]|nr:M20/M25/M40 family metallo-hydrolase [Nitrososphaerales archaeon]
SLLCIGTIDDEGPNDVTWPGMECVVSEGLSGLGYDLPEFAINAEASGLENVWGVFQGNLAFKLKFKGRTGHPPVGVNAIEKAISFWEDLISAKNDLGNSRLVWLSGGSDSEFGLTPSEAEMIFRVSIVPGNTPKQVSERIKKILSRRREQDPNFKVERLQVLSEQSGFDVGSRSSIVSKIKKAAKRIGIDASYGGGIVGSGDLFHYLVRGIPGVTYGAGALERCHVPNEFVSINELVNQTKIYALTALDICRERSN